jgi:hypothetical protein
LSVVNRGPSLRPNMTPRPVQNRPPAPAPNRPPNSAIGPARRGSNSRLQLRLDTLRGQLTLGGWILVGFAVLAFLAAVTITGTRIQKFQQIASVAVPGINATNEAFQLLSGEVSNTADYILAQKAPTIGASGVVSGTSNLAQTKQAILKQIETQRAAFDFALQSGYSALVDYPKTFQPDAQTALNYLSVRNARLHDALAYTRGLVDTNQLDAATTTFLNGQNDYYQPVISSLYFLRSVHINQLEEAAQAATGSADMQVFLAAAATILFVVCLLGVNLWLTFRVKRVLIPLLNLALVIVALYSAFLWITFANSSRNLEQVVNSYNQTSLLNDAQLHATDAAADQVQWVIGGQTQAAQGQTPARFVGDAVYEEDFKRQLELLLATKDSSGATVYTPASIIDCPGSVSERASYAPVGVLGDVCRESTSPAQVTALNNFIHNYRNWLTADTSFRTQVAGGNVNGGLTVRNGDGARAYQQMTASLNELKRLSVADYTRRSKEGTDSLNLSLILAWVVFPLSLLLAEVGILSWRREF